MTAGGVFLLFLVVGLGFAFALFALVRSEADDRQSMDRTSAERAARRDTGEDDRDRY